MSLTNRYLGALYELKEIAKRTAVADAKIKKLDRDGVPTGKVKDSDAD